MAACAIRAVASLVRIIAGMAAIAGARWMRIGIASAVTASTRGNSVAADQGVAGTGMIERHGLPGLGRMAICTGRSAGPLVGIVPCVTGRASCSQPFPALPGMA